MENKFNLLSKPIWNVNDISTYIGYKETKSREIMNICKSEFGGVVKYESSYATRDSVLRYLGTTLENELIIYKALENGDIQSN